MRLSSDFCAQMWFGFVMRTTSLLPEIQPILRFRGFLLRPVLRSAGPNFQLAKDVRIIGLRNLSVGRDVFFSAGCWIVANTEVQIHDEVMLGPYSVVIAGDHTKVNGSYRFGAAERAPITIGRGAWVGAHSVVTKGVTIGHGACVASGAVVAKSVDPDTIVGGVPAKLIRSSASGALGPR